MILLLDDQHQASSFDHSALARADCIKRAEHKRPVFAPGIMTSSWSVARCFEQVEPDPLSLWANLCRLEIRGIPVKFLGI